MVGAYTGAVVGAGTTLMASVALLQRYLRHELKRPELIHAPMEEKQLEDQHLTQEVRLLLREYWPHPLLELSGYISTCWSAMWAVLPARRAVGEIETLQLQDGGCVSLHWGLPPQRGGRERVVLVLPGLNNSSFTSFVQTTMRHLRQAGFQAVALNFRATGGNTMTAPKVGGLDSWCDLPEVTEHICKTHPDCDLFGLGFSMGAVMLLKHLGEEGHRTRLKAGVAIAGTVDVPRAVAALESTRKSRAMNFAMVNGVKLSLILPVLHSPFAGQIDIRRTLLARTIRELDEASVCKLHGYRDPDEYYAANCPRRGVPNIAVPTLLVNAEDDPIISVDSLPLEEIRRNPRLYLAITKRGGHIGWGSGGLGAACWTDAMAVDFLLACSLRSARPSRL